MTGTLPGATGKWNPAEPGGPHQEGVSDMHEAQSPGGIGREARPRCESIEWCVSEHGSTAGEEDWVHESEPFSVAAGVTARLCMSIDPVVGAQDGPYVVIDVAVDSPEYTLAEAEAFAASMTALARRGAVAVGSGATHPVTVQMRRHGL
ncbi:hypothetical protein QMG83_09125 [Salinibacterium sp. G-O1]|uniref:DUF6907 domain-containing protein n=1 Tax=Salinibacterium sp. G-O1 TaxID=3046208 RepID=UPI0024BB8490|nr:hypothetical protein [Salinibacterium sp. G-O1]MDJ0335383.1 hypothetical protein [Salinibacterium sp. G-O1]